MDLDSAGVIVTGGASGLGAGTVRHLSTFGAHIVIADIDDERGKALSAEVGDNVNFIHVDVSSTEEVEEAVRIASSRGPLRLVVNCGGTGVSGRLVNRDGSPHSLEGFELTVNKYLTGTFNVLRLAAAQMAKEPPLDDDERGVIVMTASVAAFDGQIGQSAYAAAKAGVVGLTLPAARDLSIIGVRVVTIVPGLFATPAYKTMTDAQRDSLAALALFPRRMGTPEEFASLVEHICSNRMLNGEVIRIDGAVRLPPK
jgi:NAD(P)-dependent dehydrogenase (short-subunit alcohol dehydrogenase family)